MLGELLLMLYAIFAAVLIAQHHSGWLSAPFMLLYAASFAAVVGMARSLWQNRQGCSAIYVQRRFLSRTDPAKYNAPTASTSSCQNDNCPSKRHAQAFQFNRIAHDADIEQRKANGNQSS